MTTPMLLYKKFQQVFAFYVPHVVKYKGNKSKGGIDIWLDDGSVLNFQSYDNGSGWALTKGGKD